MISIPKIYRQDDPKAVMYSSSRCDVLCRYSRQRTVLSAALAIAIRDREQFCDTVAAADGVPVMAKKKDDPKVVRVTSACIVQHYATLSIAIRDRERFYLSSQ